MKILEYTGLDTSRVKASYRKVADAIARNDFRAAQVKKLVNLSHGRFYRARLDDADRLLFSLVRHGDEVCALMLEVIANHDYDKSRFLRGAAIDESKIPDIDADDAIRHAQPLRYLHPEHTANHSAIRSIEWPGRSGRCAAEPPRTTSRNLVLDSRGDAAFRTGVATKAAMGRVGDRHKGAS